ncbi:MAG: hypothetical protein ABJB97_09915 [Acidobacteriota bacterium]
MSIMTPARLLRLLLLVSWAFPFIGGCLASLGSHPSVAAMNHFQEWERTFHPDRAVYLGFAFDCAVIAFSIVVSLAMWFFCAWGRLLYLPSGLLFAVYALLFI